MKYTPDLLNIGSADVVAFGVVAFGMLAFGVVAFGMLALGVLDDPAADDRDDDGDHQPEEGAGGDAGDEEKRGHDDPA